MAGDAFSPQARDDLFETACERNLPLEIWLGEKPEERRYTSRFLGIDESSRPPRLLIEEPAGPTPLPSGIAIQIFFIHGGQRAAFLSHTHSPGTHLLNARTVVSGLFIDYPTLLHRRQRRNYFRYRFPVREQVLLQVAPEGEGHRDEAFRWSPTIRDLSGGGLSFLLRQGSFASELAIDSRVDLAFTLDIPLPPRKPVTGETEPVQSLPVPFALVAKVRMRRTVEVDDKVHTLFGVQFADADSPDTAPYIDYLLRFVAARQRDQLQRGGP